MNLLQTVFDEPRGVLIGIMYSVGHSRSNHTRQDPAVYHYSGVQFQEASTSVGKLILKNVLQISKMNQWLPLTDCA